MRVRIDLDHSKSTFTFKEGLLMYVKDGVTHIWTHSVAARIAKAGIVNIPTRYGWGSCRHFILLSCNLILTFNTSNN